MEISVLDHYEDQVRMDKRCASIELSDSDDDLPDIKLSTTRLSNTAAKVPKYNCHDISSSSEDEGGGYQTNFIPLKDRIKCSFNLLDRETPDPGPNDGHVISTIISSTSHKDECITLDDDSNESEICTYSTEKMTVTSDIRDAPNTCLLPEKNIQPNVYSVKVQSKQSTANEIKHSNPTRTAGEIKDRKQQALEKLKEKESRKLVKMKEKEDKMALKSQEALLKNIEREKKKQYGEFKDSIMYIKVVLDTHLVNDMGLGAAMFKACESLGAQCVTENQEVPYTITWRRAVTRAVEEGGMMKAHTMDVTEDNILLVIPTTEFVELVGNEHQNTGAYSSDKLKTLPEFISNLQTHFVGKEILLVVIGMEKYFRDQKNRLQRKHKDSVRNNDKNAAATSNKGKKGETNHDISRIAVEEATTTTYLHMGCMVQMVDTSEEFADLLKSYTKAITEKHAKKDRLNSVFSFTEEGNSGVKVDKSGQGLLKVWKHQLMQFKNVSPEIAAAIVAEYPSPRLLIQKYWSCSSEKEAVSVLENITIRRGAGVLETNRRIGQEMARRIYSFVMSTDPEYIIV